MDVPRSGVARNRKIRQAVALILFVLAAAAATYGLSKLKAAAPSVDRATLWFDKATRGPMLRDIHGPGTLVPENFRWVPSSRDGLVEDIRVRVGDTVTAETVLVQLRNADLEQSLMDAELQVKAAEADLANMQATHENSSINQEIQIANLEAIAKRAALQAETDKELQKRGLISTLNVRLSDLEADNAAAQVERERQRIDVNARAAAAQIAAQQARLDQLRAAYDLKQRQIDELSIRAGVSGVLQQLSVEQGQRIGSGTTIAKVAEPSHLKAQLRIAETQAKDVILGQAASIDTRNGVVPGQVVHIDPVAVQGTVTVDVQLDGELPRGARPDLNVDGTIEIERLTDVLHVGRPASGQAEATIQLFKVLPTGEAVRTRVEVGRVSVSSIEIRDGLQEGDEVILSDMSAWEDYDRIRLN